MGASLLAKCGRLRKSEAASSLVSTRGCADHEDFSGLFFDAPGSYAAAVGDPARWPSHAKIYRAAGLNPAQYESAGRRRDGAISREGSVELRGALLELGMGLWLCEPTSKGYAISMKSRGKPAGIIACAMARRANKIAFAMVRDQTPYDHKLWS
jgi:transposase